MTTGGAPKERLRFGEFELDRSQRRLWRDGRVVKLQRRSFEILSLLLDEPGRVVTRTTFRERLWPKEVFVDFDHSLNTSVAKLRFALRDDAATPRFIETVAGVGYRFATAVDLLPQLAKPTLEPAVGELPALSAPANADVTVPGGGRFEAADRIADLRERDSLIATRPHSMSVRAALALGLALVSLLGFQLVKTWQGARLGAKPIESVAVLPLSQESIEESNAFLGPGLAEALIHRLSAHRRLIVRPANAGPPLSRAGDPLAIARNLKVDAIFVGNVGELAGEVRVALRLVRAADGATIWADELTRDRSDLVALEDALSARALAALRLPQANSDAHVIQGPRSSRAEEAYLEGRYFWNKRTKDGLSKAVERFRAALDADPRYAHGYLGLADSYMLIGGYGLEPARTMMPPARAAAQRAIELDPGLSSAHATLASIAQNYDWDWETAEREYRLAIAADPHYPTAHHWFGECLSLLARFDEAYPEFEEAERLDPLSLAIKKDHALALHYDRKPERALHKIQEALALDPTFDPAHSILATVYEFQGRFDEAFAEYRRLKLPESDPTMLSALGELSARSGQTERARAALKRLTNQPPTIYVAPVLTAWVHLALGNHEAGLRDLSRAVAARDAIGLTSLRVDPRYDAVRDDERFVTLLKALRFP